MIAVTGFRTTIVQNLVKMVNEPLVRIDGDLSTFDAEIDIPNCERYVLAAGVLHQKQILQQSAGEIQESLAVNLINTIRICETIFSRNGPASIVIIGSHSGIKGSFDTTYAVSKAGVHQYVSTKQTGEGQRINCVAPHIIKDSGMTERRHDYSEVIHRQGLISAKDVASTVKHLLYSPYLNNKIV